MHPVKITLPPSLIAADDPTEEKLAPYRDMTPEERVAITAAVCRASAALLALHADPQRVLDLEECRCLVAIWNPSYFDSEVCRAELDAVY